MGPSAKPSLAFRAVRKAKHLANGVYTKIKKLVFKPTVVAIGKYAGPGGFAATLTVVEFENLPRVSSTAKFVLKMENKGADSWKAASSPRIWVRWFIENGSQSGSILSETYSMEIPELAPGTSSLVVKEIPVPINSVVNTTVEFNLREREGPWLAGPGGPARFPRHVGGQNANGAPLDFDYEKLYADLDLDKDYWTIVGPGTREEYEHLGHAKCKQLTNQGLNSNSKVLDVGCGTGQLAGPLSAIIGPNGLYYGTDLAGPAIEFCKRKYTKPNFHFIKNDQNTIPIQGIQFDVIYLGSVFTHMYPDDIHVMLSDLRRLMAPTGFVIVDAFVSPEIPDYIGSRAMIQLNESKLQKSFVDRGFDFSEASTMPWNDHCRRVVYKLTALEASASLPE